MAPIQNKTSFSSQQILSTLEDQQTVLRKMGVKNWFVRFVSTRHSSIG